MLKGLERECNTTLCKSFLSPSWLASENTPSSRILMLGRGSFSSKLADTSWHPRTSNCRRLSLLHRNLNRHKMLDNCCTRIYRQEVNHCCIRIYWWWWWLFPCLWGIGENVRPFIPGFAFSSLFFLLFFKVEISLRTLIPLFKLGSVHSGSSS